VGFVVMVVIGALLMAFPVMVMWNYVVPEVIGWKAIDFWQALVLSTLCGTLFKSPSSSSK
jgi:hypothetical protein